MNIENKLITLSKSKFRSSFHLNPKMKEYVNAKGIEIITQHAYDFIETRLALAFPKNDGHQTPMQGHPVFIAQHACACCCRSCLEKWHKIEKGRKLKKEEIDTIVELLMTWIKKECQNKKGK